jgi:hypothetical protein
MCDTHRVRHTPGWCRQCTCPCAQQSPLPLRPTFMGLAALPPSRIHGPSGTPPAVPPATQGSVLTVLEDVCEPRARGAQNNLVSEDWCVIGRQHRHVGKGLAVEESGQALRPGPGLREAECGAGRAGEGQRRQRLRQREQMAAAPRSSASQGAICAFVATHARRRWRGTGAAMGGGRLGWRGQDRTQGTRPADGRGSTAGPAAGPLLARCTRGRGVCPGPTTLAAWTWATSPAQPAPPPGRPRSASHPRCRKFKAPIPPHPP